ncbi:hypothetical protein GCK32_015053 [Trichostrongylus colubriformis]|uniref:Uncharacterized protein n=1 Tax=Trichostrongylus colubriformis TaxID=6319 RepID=A0AAN8ID49_TRICO
MRSLYEDYMTNVRGEGVPVPDLEKKLMEKMATLEKEFTDLRTMKAKLEEEDNLGAEPFLDHVAYRLYIHLFREKRRFDDFSARLDEISGGHQELPEEPELDPVYLKILQEKTAEADHFVRQMKSRYFSHFDKAIKEEPPSDFGYSVPYDSVVFGAAVKEDMLNEADPFETVGNILAIKEEPPSDFGYSVPYDSVVLGAAVKEDMLNEADPFETKWKNDQYPYHFHTLDISFIS